jgi:hypothetical protein
MSTNQDHASHTAVQQGPGLWRTQLQQHDLSIPGREVVQQRVEIGPRSAGRQAHPSG